MKQLFIFLCILTSLYAHGQAGKFVETNGVKLYYKTLGQGEPLVLLHGGTMTHDMWTPWMGDLAKSFKVIAVDLRGHGQSTNPTNDFSFKEIALDIFGLLKELNVDNFRAMGFSGGGMTLIHMATMYPDRIKSLVLFGSAPYFPVDSRKQMKMLTYDLVSKNNPNWIEYVKNVQPGGEEQYRNVFKWFTQAADSYDSRSMNFTPPQLATINCPTLIIQGDEEPNWTLDIPMVLQESIPNSNLWIIPNLGHQIPQYGTALGNLFLITITDFMTGKWDE